VTSRFADSFGVDETTVRRDKTAANAAPFSGMPIRASRTRPETVKNASEYRDQGVWQIVR